MQQKSNSSKLNYMFKWFICLIKQTQTSVQTTWLLTIFFLPYIRNTVFKFFLCTHTSILIISNNYIIIERILFELLEKNNFHLWTYKRIRFTNLVSLKGMNSLKIITMVHIINIINKLKIKFSYLMNLFTNINNLISIIYKYIFVSVHI